MVISKDEISVLNKVKKKASLLSEGALIVSKPKAARSFLVDTRRRMAGTRQTYKRLIQQVKFYKHLTHEVENLFDNYYVVDGAITDVLDRGVDRGFQKLVQVEKKPTVFIPRIYFILTEFLKISEYKMDRDTLYGFLETYQSKAHLSIRELSFVPYFLKVILIENVEQMMQKSTASLHEFKEAEYWFDQIVKKGEAQTEKDFSKLTSELTAKYGLIPVNLGFYLLQKLSQYGPDTRPLVKWLKLNFLKQGININDLAKIENKRQGDLSLTISNIINSLHWINKARWDDFVEELNVVDSFLAKDPAGVYSRLDPASQTAYRNEIVKISERTGIYESEVAKMTLRLCQLAETNKKASSEAENHIGYYLLGAGRGELYRRVGYRTTIAEKFQSLVLKKSIWVYLGLLGLINILLTIALLTLFPSHPGSAISLSVLAGLFLILNCDIVINLVNILISSFLPVRALFRLDLSHGLDEEQSTIVVVPSMFRGEKEAQELLRRLEVNYLGNDINNIYYALLLDFKDSVTEKTPADLALVERMRRGISELNAKYPGSVKRFYLFHRRRKWNPQENVFMGWERKRGKLREFNLLLRNKRPTSYVEAWPSDLPRIKYVLTIDEDTRLPRDSAAKLVGCLDHPLNRPVWDPLNKRVKSGYGIIQPRMTTKFSQAEATPFSRMFSSAIGIDSYSGPVADVYQDLFNNSIFYGKGIYDVDLMESAIGDRIPENRVLSHDLLEGLYTKVGFATDIFLFEGFPESYKEYTLRLGRWIRGDWQIAGWMKNGGVKDNHFNLSDKWKIFDNLRRSLSPIFAVLFLLVTALTFTDAYLFSLIYILLAVGSPFVITYFFQLFHWPKESTLFMKLNMALDNLDSAVWHLLFRFIFLLDQALVSLQAFGSALYRLYVSRRHLLQWQNSHEVSRSLKGTVREFVYQMWPAEILSLLGFIILPSRVGLSLYLTLILWLVAPFVAYAVSQREKKIRIKARDENLLRQVACRSARFFLELSGREGNRLIPDHFQEEPATNSPAATSPTNIGMHLLSNLSAYDFGYISLTDFLSRTAELCDNLDSLERYRGHFYNWYDIRTLQALNPKYVSSVDSANLLLAILALKQGILDSFRRPIFASALWRGLADVLSVLAEDAEIIIKDPSISKAEKKKVRLIRSEARSALDALPVPAGEERIDQLVKILDRLALHNDQIKQYAGELTVGVDRGRLSGIYSSVDHLNSLINQQKETVLTLLPFYRHLEARPVVRQEGKNRRFAQALSKICQVLNTIPAFSELDDIQSQVSGLNFIPLLHRTDLTDKEKEAVERWYGQVLKSLITVQDQAVKLRAEGQKIISVIDTIFEQTDFTFLYDRERGLFHIGYNTEEGKADSVHYYYLASEANAISFIAILKKQIPVKHWFYLGRKLIRLDMRSVLLSSWGGSLFEYLTSHLFFHVHPSSLLGYTAERAIESHMKYGRKYHTPWGMGESAYSALDLNNNYQYQIFGHPSLGFKRDLKDYLVVAPYTSLLSLAFKPRAAVANIRKLIKEKILGRYGFYDAVDYSSRLEKADRLTDGRPAKIFYAHHQGFSLQALNNYLNDNRLYALFSADPRVEALDTLFEERIPSSVPATPVTSLERVKTDYLTAGINTEEVKQFVPLFTSYPRRAFISNGTYSVEISNLGAGVSRCAGYTLTRFREDPVNEPWGQFHYLYDLDSHEAWSPTTAPLGVAQGKCKIEFFENKAHFTKIYHDLESVFSVSVAPEANAEFRSLTLTNHSKETKNLRLGSYGEVSLSKGNEDLHHPAFEKLFVKSDYWPKYKALVYSRPSKEARGESVYFAHQLLSAESDLRTDQTTERGQFFSRGGSRQETDAFTRSFGSLKLNAGHNLDPIFCFQNELSLAKNQTVTFTYVNIFATTREELVRQLKKYSGLKNIEISQKRAGEQGRQLLGSLGLSGEQALNYQALGSRLMTPNYSAVALTAWPDKMSAGIETLWRLGISGDRPILVVRFQDLNDLALVKNILLAHKYLKYKGVVHDLVLVNEYPSSYLKSFEDEVDFQIRYSQSSDTKSLRGRVYHLRGFHLPPADRDTLFSLARAVIDSRHGTLEEQILALIQSGPRQPVTYLAPAREPVPTGRDICPNLDKLKFYNGLGGFDGKKRAYTLNVNYSSGQYPSVPWVNILANKNIGSVVTESGSMYTWLYDSYDNRLTKRLDDPLLGESSEALYLRDEESGDFWCPTPLPVKNEHTYTVTHGLGHTDFSHKSRGLKQELSVLIPAEDSVKIIKLKLTNSSKVQKRLSLSVYFEMSLGGTSREETKNYLRTVRDRETGAMLVQNIFSAAFKNTLAFADLAAGDSIFTNDRDEFLGKGGTADNPSAMKRDKLSNTVHPNTDHCLALQTFFDLSPGAEKEIVILLGGGQSTEEVRRLIKKYRSLENREQAQVELAEIWKKNLDAVRIETPDESLNTLFNDRLLYQLISSRLLARTGYYQPSGAYGFRDQLQDSLALVWSRPEMTREIILKAAAHQFVEGDALNWWHDHNNFGVRSAFSDHQLWLAYVTATYVENTADRNILTERLHYLKAPLLDFEQNPRWAGIPEISPEKTSLYDHCLRALEKTFSFGPNGLPLIGNGDWNDGLNKVGEKGIGESVWLGWFLIATIEKFKPLLEEQGDEERVRRYDQIVKDLKLALEKKAWDGRWYRRAFFDSGLPLGSRSNTEYQIDSVAQSWAVLSGAGRSDRRRQAMTAVERHLFQNDLLLLISPALEKADFDPGYIKDYPPGVRENGAQYNHAALWSAQAFAELGDSATAMKIIDSVNPIKRSQTPAGRERYRVEPYVVASDIYARPMEAGRGGWTWYTGSAGVMYRTILENILGIRVRGNKLEIKPCVPKDWPEFSLVYTYRTSKYHIRVINSASVINKKIRVDGELLSANIIYLMDDGKKHEVEVKI